MSKQELQSLFDLLDRFAKSTMGEDEATIGKMKTADFQEKIASLSTENHSKLIFVMSWVNAKILNFK